MQTFLPYPSITLSIECLDSKRLGKQRVEAKQILNTLEGKSLGWAKHPAVKMWAGHENLLKIYINVAIAEWIRRGYKNTMRLEKEIPIIKWPMWFGNEGFHASHRSNLLRKDPEFYGKYNWSENHEMKYIWPIK